MAVALHHKLSGAPDVEVEDHITGEARWPFERAARKGNLARRPGLGNATPMEKRCEVCERFRPHGDLKPGRELSEIPFGDRLVSLCAAHAKIAKNSRVSSFDELRQLYAESEGQRSYLARRAITERAEEGAPRSVGRRASDS